MNPVFVTTTLAPIECVQCRMTFGAPESFITERRRDHKTFHCPRGHTNYFPGESDLEEQKRLRKQAERERAREAKWHDQTRSKLRSAKKSRDAHKGQVTRIKNRVAAGVCPCCSRTFRQLARHMKTKHPTWNKSEAPHA